MLRRLRSNVPSRIRRSYALKFGIVLLLIGASVGMIGFVATEEIRAHVQSEADEEFTTLAEQEARSLQAWSESNEQRVETLVRSPDLRIFRRRNFASTLNIQNGRTRFTSSTPTTERSSQARIGHSTDNLPLNSRFPTRPDCSR